MERAKVWSLTLVALGILHSNHVVHVLKGGQLGQSVFWEWRYFHDELKMRDQQWRWRGDNQRMGTWDRLSAAWSLSQDAWLHCTGPETMQGHVREFSCQTEAMLPLLLDIYARPGPRSTRREDAKDIAIRMLTLSVKGIAGLRVADVRMSSCTCGIPITLGISDTGVITGLAEAFGVHPELKQWAVTCSRGFALMPDSGGDYTIVTLFLFTFWLGWRCSAASTPLQIWAKAVAQQLNKLAALLLERYICEDYMCKMASQQQQQQQASQQKALPAALTTKGGHHRRIDPATVEHNATKMLQLHGSQSTISTALTGNSFWSHWLTYTYNRLYMQAASNMYEGLLQIALAWDPGSYGGEGTNVGYICSPSAPGAAYIPTKAPIRTASMYCFAWVPNAP